MNNKTYASHSGKFGNPNRGGFALARTALLNLARRAHMWKVRWIISMTTLPKLPIRLKHRCNTMATSNSALTWSFRYFRQPRQMTP